MNETDPLPRDLSERYGPRALILGGSEGIGASFADRLAHHGLDLTLVARNGAALDRTAEALRSRYGVTVDTHVLDLTAPAIDASAASILDAHDYGLVIYNAGATHGVGLFLDSPVERALDLVRLNCIGPVALAHRALTAMRERRRGGLILVSSMSGLAGAGYVATYAAAKSFEMVLAEGLHWELARDGVDIMCLVATLTDTPAMTRSGIILDADAQFIPMDPDVVAEGALTNLGHMPLWFAAGEETAQAMRTAPRATLTESMTRSSARMWGIDV